jgi:acyl-CoA dehydrogenase
MKRTLFSSDHEIFRQTVRGFFLREVVPHQERWAEAGIVDREVWRAAGAALCPWMEEEHGGAGGDFLHSVVIMEELANGTRAASP